MIRRALCLVAAAASLGAAAATSAVPATATTATTTTPTHVGVVVRLSDSSTLTACVTQGGDGLDVLVRGFPNTQIPTSGPYAGFVVSVDDVGQNPPDDTHYWSYWHATATGWKYSSTGGGSYTPKAGAVEGWSYDDGQNNPPKPATYSYQKLCASKDPKPAPSSTQPSTHPARPTRHPTHAGTHSPAHHPASRPSHTSTAPTTSSTVTSRPSASTAARSTRARPSRSSNPHSAGGRPSRSAGPSTDTANGGPTSAAPHSSAVAAPVPSPSLQPTASHRSSSGFPAWGTLLAIIVVAALGGTAWLRLRRRPE